MGQNDFHALIDAYYRKNIAALRRKYRAKFTNLRQSAVDEGIQQAFVKLLRQERQETLAVTTLEQLHALVSVAIANTLIDGWREGQRENPKQTVDTAAAQSGKVTPLGADLPLPAEELGFETHWLEASIEDRIDTRDLLRKVGRALSAKNRMVMWMLLMGYKPAEIGAYFDQDGHVLVRWVRNQICKAFSDLGASGDEQAVRLHGLVC